MSRINQFREIDRQLADLLKAHEKLEKDPEVRKELEFERLVKELVAEHGMTAAQVIEILAPERNTAAALGRTQLPVRTYRNPHTGEAISLKRASNKQLKAWIAEYGQQEVETWIVEQDTLR